MQTLPSVLENEAVIPRLEERDDLGAPVISERTDLQLIELVQAGHATAFEELFERHKRYVARLAGRYLTRPEEIEEMIQIVFAKVFVELPRFRGDHEFSLTGWLRQITVNASIDILRSKKRRPEDICSDITEGDIADLAEAANHDPRSEENALVDRDLAIKLLGHLEPEDRVVMQMLYVEELSVAEIAEMLGWSASKVKIRAWRARRSLRKILSKYV
ncbi:RNA polymerase sigma factor [Leptolyngbya sp. 7M]|uniref:RNA polymerase sigma factor n=1 Tax=Leptolyngbya sp. 7M TaxID=2812896 RepID=UPI001CEC9D8F|nr:sigma-70 family RNA polymerase sigma factor [Leptolyngbya sp. 7M]